MCSGGSAAEAQKGEESVEERGDEAEYSVHFHSFFWWAEARLGIAPGGTRLHFDALVYQAARVMFVQ